MRWIQGPWGIHRKNVLAFCPQKPLALNLTCEKPSGQQQQVFGSISPSYCSETSQLFCLRKAIPKDHAFERALLSFHLLDSKLEA